ncbi:MAG: heparinase II/III family protein [Candidatus Latescibacteria bacterium]|nr:heparinase II/III family protein [Candidatus Latescibacterota bacterium]
MRLMMNKACLIFLFTILSVFFNACGGDDKVSETAIPRDSQRLRELEDILFESPKGFGSPISNRAIWEHIASLPAFTNFVGNAEKLIGEPVPELPDTLFLEFSRNGNRYNYQSPNSRRRSILSQLVIGECIENNGRFLADIERFIRNMCSEKTWVLPAHDRKLDNFYGRIIQIDLGVATTSWYLATVDYLLGDHLSPEIRKLIRDEVQRRTFDPFLRMIRGEDELIWWMTEKTNNWNSVCIGGVVGAAMALIGSPDDRAWFLLGTERYAPNYLLSFTDDGYCSEGLGYWNYGFGHYIMLAEAVSLATGGKMDIMTGRKIENIARYPINIEIMDGVYPAFADCHVGAKPSTRYMRYLNRRFDFGLDTYEQAERSSDGQLYEMALFEINDPYSENKSSVKLSTGESVQSTHLRSWFENAGVLICRPSSGKKGSIGVALKGGHNNEHHNHNDVGSFVVVLDGKSLLLDPGGEVYTGRTFSDQRYESNVLNSFGHPVPRIDGTLQKTGEEACGKVVSTTFTDSKDTLVLDISSAYDIDETEKLERSFEYSREGRGSLTITDRAVFSMPRSFDTALITFSSWRVNSDGSIEVYDDDTAVQVDIAVTGSEYEIQTTEIREDLPVKRNPMRLAIVLKNKVKDAEVRVKVTPK